MSVLRVVFALLLILSLSPFAHSGGADPWMMGAGGSWVDYDNDGDLDLIFLKGEGDCFLFRNTDGAFEDITLSAIPLDIAQPQETAPGISMAWADLNNDGWVDVFIGKTGYNVLLMSNGDGTFRDCSRSSALAGSDRYLSSAAAALDVDGDGWLDLFVANYTEQPNFLYINNGSVDSNGDVRFTERALDAGVRWSTQDGATATLGVATGDYNNDGLPDIYLGNDFGGFSAAHGIEDGPNVLFKNNGDGTFTDVSVSSGANEPGFAMGVTFGDYNNDGWLDLFVANFWQDALLENNGDGTFTDVTVEQDIVRGTPEEWHYNGWGTALFDFDNDGDLDLHVANGFIVNNVGQITYEPDQLFENLGASQDYRFEEISAKTGINQTGDSRGSAYGDFDRDGLLDIFVINTGFELEPGVDPGPERLLFHNMGDGTFKDIAYQEGIRGKNEDATRPRGYDNNRANHWIQIRPVGAYSESHPSGAPRTPFGTRITVTAGGHTYIQDMGSSSYASQNSPYLHFGLGGATLIDEIRVRFPNGVQQVLSDVAPDQILTVSEAQGVPVGTVHMDLLSRAGGVELRWTYNPDVRDLDGFLVSREIGGNRTLLASGIQGLKGRASYVDRHPVPGETVTYVLQALSKRGELETLARQEYTFEIGTGFRLMAPRPNPFRTSTAIPVRASTPGVVRVEIMDVQGRRVAVLSRTVPAGNSILAWDGLDLRGEPAGAGVYYARIPGAPGAESSPVKLIKRP